MTKKLKELLDRAESWPEEAQEEAAASLQAIEQELHEPYVLTEADKKAIDRGIAAANAGKFATDKQVEAMFSKFHPS